MGDRITPTPGYAPQPSEISRDRDGREIYLPSGPGKKKRKKKRKKEKDKGKKKPAPDRAPTSNDPEEPGDHVDIRAVQIETIRGNNPALSSALAQSA